VLFNHYTCLSTLKGCIILTFCIGITRIPNSNGPMVLEIITATQSTSAIHRDDAHFNASLRETCGRWLVHQLTSGWKFANLCFFSRLGDWALITLGNFIFQASRVVRLKNRVLYTLLPKIKWFCMLEIKLQNLMFQSCNFILYDEAGIVQACDSSVHTFS